MSRNFELLQRLDRERGLAQEPAEELTAAQRRTLKGGTSHGAISALAVGRALVPGP